MRVNLSLNYNKFRQRMIPSTSADSQTRVFSLAHHEGQRFFKKAMQYLSNRGTSTEVAVSV